MKQTWFLTANKHVSSIIECWAILEREWNPYNVLAHGIMASTHGVKAFGVLKAHLTCLFLLFFPALFGDHRSSTAVLFTYSLSTEVGTARLTFRVTFFFVPCCLQFAWKSLLLPSKKKSLLLSLYSEDYSWTVNILSHRDIAYFCCTFDPWKFNSL